MTDVSAPRPQTALVTGGTDGIGHEVARALAQRGIKTIIVGRDRQKGEAAEKQLRAGSPKGEVYFVRADLSLESFSAKCPTVGGVLYNPRSATETGRSAARTAGGTPPR